MLLFWYQEIIKRQIFGHSLMVPPPLPPKTPKGTKKITFLTVYARALVFFFFGISKYLIEKYFDIIWGTNHLHHPNGPPKIIFLNKQKCVKPNTWVQLSGWPSLLSNENYIKSSILIFFNMTKSLLILFVLTLDMIKGY